METRAMHGMILGAIVGVFVGVALSLMCNTWWCMLLVPFTALMGAAPQMLKPKDDDNDD
ncbi:MAG: hypothetical protein II933_00995 [Candidatus Methanomethylophilaceae archaeon]|nr:hypothetical protein [Candidatus Methanomethylophilaceae archaeon]